MKSRRTTLVLATLAGIGLLGATGACSMLGSQVATAETGDCVVYDDIPADITSIPTVDCTESHDGQVVGKFDMPEGDYPGADAVNTAAEEGCRTAFADFIGLDFDSSTLQMTYVSPSEDTWNQADDREVICFALSDEMVTESWEGAAI